MSDQEDSVATNESKSKPETPKPDAADKLPADKPSLVLSPPETPVHRSFARDLWHKRQSSINAP